MKKIICLLLSVCLLVSLCACGSDKAPADPSASGTTNEPSAEAESGTESSASEDDLIEDPFWDDLEALGKVETENGLFFVSITLPAALAGSDLTQESLDANAGETYTSAKLNEDGSVTYRMTKRQHKAMLDSTTTAVDEGIQELVAETDNAFTRIEHNADFTVYDAYLSTDEIGFTESFSVILFYLYGGIYSILSGHEADNIAVNYYSSTGDLISTANSSDFFE